MHAPDATRRRLPGFDEWTRVVGARIRENGLQRVASVACDRSKTDGRGRPFARAMLPRRLAIDTGRIALQRTQDGSEPGENTVRHRDLRTQQGFIPYPKLIFADNRVSFAGRILYGLLKGYAWQEGHCRPGQQTLARDMGVSDRQVRTYLRELVDVGLVEIERRGLTQTNVYLLTDSFRSDRKPGPGQERGGTSDEVEAVEVEAGGKPPAPRCTSATNGTRERGKGARRRRQAKKEAKESSPQYNPALAAKLIGSVE